MHTIIRYTLYNNTMERKNETQINLKLILENNFIEIIRITYMIFIHILYENLIKSVACVHHITQFSYSLCSITKIFESFNF